MPKTESKIKFYASLSLSKKEILKKFPKATVSPIIARGDIKNDIAAGIDALAIIDGAFEQVMSVSPGELLDALNAGIRVYGSSSMGALRAAELQLYGMIGHGKIFEMIAADPFFRDDYLGQVFDPETAKPLSMTYVDFHFHLLNLERRKKISPSQGEKLRELFRDIHFSRRTLRSLTEAVEKKQRHDSNLIKAAKLVFSQEKTQKHLDAVSLLDRMSADLEDVAAFNKKLSNSLAGKTPHFYSS